MTECIAISIQHTFDLSGAHAALALHPIGEQLNHMRLGHLMYRQEGGKITGYLATETDFLSQSNMLYYAVVCNDVDFFRYTELPRNIVFGQPYFYWTSEQETSSIMETHVLKDTISDTEELNYLYSITENYPNTLGIIGITAESLRRFQQHILPFQVKTTFWEYRIYPKENQTQWNYQIHDTHGEWNFERIRQEGDSPIIFRSVTEIPFFKKVENRLYLHWNSDDRFEEGEKLNLPYANYTYTKLMAENEKTLTPIYIHL